MELFDMSNNYNIFFPFATHFKSSSSTASRELRQRLVVDEDDNGKLKGLKGLIMVIPAYCRTMATAVTSYVLSE